MVNISSISHGLEYNHVFLAFVHHKTQITKWQGHWLIFWSISCHLVDILVHILQYFCVVAISKNPSCHPELKNDDARSYSSHMMGCIIKLPGTAPYTTTLYPPLFRSNCAAVKVYTTILRFLPCVYYTERRRNRNVISAVQELTASINTS